MTSQNFREAFFASETSDGEVVLITLTHPTLVDESGDPVVIRLAANSEDIVSRGNMYLGCPIEIIWPSHEERTPPRGHFRCGAVSDPDHPENDIILIMRNSQGISPSITFEMMLISDLDGEPEMTAPDMILETVDFDGSILEGDLAFVNALQEQYPAHSYTQTLFPGVFAG